MQLCRSTRLSPQNQDKAQGVKGVKEGSRGGCCFVVVGLAYFIKCGILSEYLLSIRIGFRLHKSSSSSARGSMETRHTGYRLPTYSRDSPSSVFARWLLVTVCGLDLAAFSQTLQP